MESSAVLVQKPLYVVVITGVSGSGKSVALAALEDIGYFCVDNLPPSLLETLVNQTIQDQRTQLAIAIDVRSSRSLASLPVTIQRLKQQCRLTILFLDATDNILLQRFSATRRRHPLSQNVTNADPQQTLQQAITLERQLLEPMQTQAHHIDSSACAPTQLREKITQLLGSDVNHLTLTFESFAYKRGVPLNADFVIDARCLPNPYHIPALSQLTGLDNAVVVYFQTHPLVQQFIDDLQGFLFKWLEHYRRDQRSYLTVAIGCTGGQHRSVYVVHALALAFIQHDFIVERHRELPISTL